MLCDDRQGPIGSTRTAMLTWGIMCRSLSVCDVTRTGSKTSSQESKACGERFCRNKKSDKPNRNDNFSCTCKEMNNN